MKDHTEVPEPQPDNTVDPGPARPLSGSAPYPEMYLYLLLFVSFTTGAAISIIVDEALSATGSPLDTVRSILQNMWRAAGAGTMFAVTVVLVSKTARSVSRCRRKLLFKSQEGGQRRK